MLVTYYSYIRIFSVDFWRTEFGDKLCYWWQLGGLHTHTVFCFICDRNAADCKIELFIVAINNSVQCHFMGAHREEKGAFAPDKNCKS